MKLRAEKEMQKPDSRPEARNSMKRPMAALLGAVAIGAVLAEGCKPCPVADGCGKTSDYEISLAPGETVDTMAGGVPVHITAETISMNAKVDGAVCRAYGGSAHVRLSVESDPPLEQEFDISSSMCFAVDQICTPHIVADASAGEIVENEVPDGGVPQAACVPRCIAFNNTEVTADVELVGTSLYDGDGGGTVVPDGGVLSGSCLITNKRVSFTLTLGE